MYPGGASPQGVLDLAGNVWEWCLNPYDHPREKTLGGEGARVLRGGSWGNLRPYARCRPRIATRSRARNYEVGFRVCCAPVR